jgi:hypothetical protein
MTLNSFKLKLHREHKRLVSCHLEVDSVKYIGSNGCYTFGDPSYIMDNKDIFGHIRRLYNQEKLLW